MREALETALEGKYPAYALREHYELENPEACVKAAPPEGYKLRAVDAGLLGEGLLRTGELKEEMCSERTSVEAFLAESFGVCAVSGNFCDGAGDFGKAAEWYAKAVAEPAAPLWAYVRWAMALTSLGRSGEALDALNAAVQKGFNNRGWLMSEPRLEPLREEDGWKQLF